jgi:hypothetical protein
VELIKTLKSLQQGKAIFFTLVKTTGQGNNQNQSHHDVID